MRSLIRSFLGLPQPATYGIIANLTEPGSSPNPFPSSLSFFLVSYFILSSFVFCWIRIPYFILAFLISMQEIIHFMSVCFPNYTTPYSIPFPILYPGLHLSSDLNVIFLFYSQFVISQIISQSNLF